MTAIVPLALCGYLIIVAMGCFGNSGRARNGVRALDHFVKASVFNGTAWESVSSHACRKREKTWSKIVIWITDKFQDGHCRKANKREQPVVDLVMQKRLYKQTIY